MVFKCFVQKSGKILPTATMRKSHFFKSHFFQVFSQLLVFGQFLSRLWVQQPKTQNGQHATWQGALPEKIYLKK